MIRLFTFVILAVLLVSCKDERPVSVNGKDLSQEIIPVKELPIPPSCEYIPVEWIADRFDLDPELINVTDGKAGEGMSGCFFRWSAKEKPNAGVFIQVYTNPIEEETKTWASLRMQGLRAGNAGTTEEESTVFKPFPGVGDEGAYNEALGQYYWRVGENYVFMLAFNLDITAEERYEHAEAISQEVMKNFRNLIK